MAAELLWLSLRVSETQDQDPTQALRARVMSGALFMPFVSVTCVRIGRLSEAAPGWAARAHTQGHPAAGGSA